MSSEMGQKTGEGESPSFALCGSPFSPQTCLAWILLTFALKFHLLLYT